ncbi:hypothetical protein [Shewanella sediminis]|uniref:hypothetical protein n=1 Tax=Shewanella sediminis TaxID=271097 RepID=UPI0002FBAA57|nr:hypothetical protein [Shewanella sediminis]
MSGMPSMSNSSAASSGTGDQANNASFTGGNVDFGMGSGAGGNSNMILFGLLALGALWLLTQKK